MGNPTAKPATDLRTRIITAMLSEDDVALMADAVIRELGLRQETERQRQYSWNPNRTTRHRYVTEWRSDEDVYVHEDPDANNS